MASIKHIEIAGVDAEKLEAFYGQLFGWAITTRNVAGFDYRDVDLPGDLSGGIRQEPDGPAEIVIYVEVDELEAAVGRAEALGARIRIPPMDYGELRFALVTDPEGNPIGLTQKPTAGED
ncbi:MAG: VOC family protein [Pseudomonadota bacterium]